MSIPYVTLSKLAHYLLTFLLFLLPNEGNLLPNFPVLPTGLVFLLSIKSPIESNKGKCCNINHIIKKRNNNINILSPNGCMVYFD